LNGLNGPQYSLAIEPFDRTHGRLLKRLERAGPRDTIHDHEPSSSTASFTKFHFRVKRFERSVAVEPFDKTQGRLIERLEWAAVFGSGRAET